MATDDAGEEYVLNVFVKIRYSQTLTGPGAATRGIPWIETQDGSSVNSMGEGKYQVVLTGLMLHSNDPDAPR